MDRKIISPAASAGAGAAAGVVAGMVMGLVAMFRALGMGMSFWLPMQQIGALFYGVNALLGGVGPTIVGMMIHLAMSAGAGLLFGLVAARLPGVVAFFLGLLYGAGIWAMTTFLILPLIDPTMSDRVALAPGWWFGYHLIFGAVLALASPLASTMRQTSQDRPPVTGAQPV